MPSEKQPGFTPDNASQDPAREPIAIVGIGCRFPEAPNTREFWKLLVEGRNAIREIPKERFDIDAFHDPRPNTPGKMLARHGGFLDDAFGFDAEYFGISPREAARLDPQQRILLEVTAEALEDAFLTPPTLARHTAGVYVGCWTSDWECHEYADRQASDVYSMAGSGRCLISGRVSFAFDLRGPSLTVDTGCSASLIATHLACQSLWLGESSLAVCAGVNLVLDPKQGITFSQGGMLAADGQCKAFDSRADGLVRSDGCGVVVLMPLSAALASGSRVYAVIRGSGVSNDGFSNGLLATPSEVGQELAMRAAYRAAGLSPRDVQYVEAHGTGTRAGDPVELRALAALMRDRPADQPCLVGSVKTNIGHTEGAAGVAGLIKAALAIHHRTIPGSLHLQEPTPLVTWDELKLRVATETQPWPSGIARAGVSSFGISGTDVHLVLEEPEVATRARAFAESSPARAQLLALSAMTDDALRASATAYRQLIATDAADSGELHDICFSAALGRTQHSRRLTAVGSTREAMLEALDAYLAGTEHPALSVERAASAEVTTVFVFPGQGSQWQGMGLQLMATEPVFRDALEACDRALRKYASWSLLEELASDRAGAAPPIDVIQPSIFAMQVALSALLRSYGVLPGLVIGHSMGEVAAAHVAGALSLDDAARIICHRSRVLESLRGQGGMLSVELGFDEAEALVAAHPDVSVAASNGTHTTVLSGSLSGLDAIAAELRERQVFCRTVQVEAAAHSPQLDPCMPAFARALTGVVPNPDASVPLCSTVTGTMIDPGALDVDYWVSNMRQPVRFSGALQALLDAGRIRLVEISPHPVLLGPMQQLLHSTGKSAATLCTLRRDEPEQEQLLRAVGKLHTLGQSVDFRALCDDAARFVPLPHYPWQHEQFAELPGRAAAASAAQTGIDAAALGEPLRSGLHPNTYLCETLLRAETSSYLRDHTVASAVTLPGAAYVDMALQAAGRVFGSDQYAIEHLRLTSALIVPEGAEVRLQVAVHRSQPGRASLRFLAPEVRDGAGFTLHASASARLLEVAPTPPDAIDPDAIRARCEPLALDEHFRVAKERGIEFGPAFRGLQELWTGEREAFARIALPAGVRYRKGAFCIHPVLLDACWQTPAALLFANTHEAALYLPVEVESVLRFAEPGTEVLAHARLRTAPDAHEVVIDVSVFDLAGNPLLATHGLKLRQVTSKGRVDEALYQMQWQERERPAPATQTASLTDQVWLILADRGQAIASKLATWLEARGARCVLAHAGEAVGQAEHCLDPQRPHDFTRLVAAARAHGTLSGVIDLWPLDTVSTAEAGPETLRQAQNSGVIALTHLVQALHAAGIEAARIWAVTANTQPVVPGQRIEVAQAPLWGLSRVLRYEFPELLIQCVDLGDPDSNADLDALQRELLTAPADYEAHLALREGRSHVLRLVPAPFESEQPDAATLQLSAAAKSSRAGLEPVPYQLTTAAPGIFDNLELRETDRPKPAPNEVEIEVVVGGLNFIDVMKSLGIYPGMAAGSTLFGGECAGRISALGSEVREFTLGQRVVAMSSGERGCFARFVVTRAAMVAPLPERLTFEQGATIPAVFLTAHYAMNTLGHLTAGERVLIHSATGGVGLAAVQLARRAGAEIFATAGNPEKRAFLHELGIEHVFDSRSTAFADEIRRVTEGSGVDMVLNSLAGDAIAESLDLLRDDGRFLEIGKRDIYQDAALGLAPFKRGLSFSHIDLGRLVRDRADKMGALLRELLGMFEAGELEPLPTTRFPISEAPEAFRFMAQAKHIGKIVLSTEDPQLDARVLPSAELARADGTYLVTGGFGGLGLLVAEWLVGQGARHLLLLGRSKPSAQASERVERLRQRGVTVSVQACDVSRAEQLEATLAVAQAELPPLRGVLHAAAVLDDGVALQLTPERFWNAMGPKLLGAWNLHASTRQLPLDFFVVFSSAAATVGSPGQANYAAGNEFMDALTHARRAAGLVALSIDWGPWRESGIAAGSQRAGRLGTRGMGSFSDADGLELLGKLMRSERTQAVAVANADFQRWTQFYPSVARGGLLEEVLRKKAATQAQDSTTRREILEAPAEQRIERVVAHVSQVLRRVLRISDAKQLDLDVPLNRFGIDSLMAVELKNRLECDLGVTITVSKILLSTGMQQLAGELLALMTKEEAATPLAAATAPVQDTGGALERLFSDLDDESDLLDEELIEEKRMSA